MAKGDPAISKQASSKKEKKSKNSGLTWVITIFFTTILVSGVFSFASNALMDASGVFVAFVVLLLIVLVGIVFDVIGVAVTSAEERPFHSMAAKKVSAASEAIMLLRNADKVASICNDVIGDICGVVSGAAAANISAQLITRFGLSGLSIVSLCMSALVAGLTVGGKALGKSFALRSSTRIVLLVSRVIYGIRHFPSLLFCGKGRSPRKEKRK